MDSSVTRRGQPCWYKQPNVGTIAINDTFILESMMYKVIKQHFKSASYYGDILELFREVTYQTGLFIDTHLMKELGQLMDLITAPEDSVDLAKFTIAKYSL